MQTQEARRLESLLLSRMRLSARSWPLASVCLYGSRRPTEPQTQENGDFGAEKPPVEALRRQGIIPGTKVDKGAKALAGFADEKVTKALDGLRDRLAVWQLVQGLKRNE